MKLSSRTRYGIRAILGIAIGYGIKPLQGKAIAEREDISSKYLEQLIAMLKRAGLVNGVRGPHGGYILAKPPSEISMKDVVLALEGPMLPEKCRRHPKHSPQCADCITSQVCQELQNVAMAVLEKVTVAELLERSS
jgi:Rrf2 family cysteine metabolism transcriptional repressor